MHISEYARCGELNGIAQQLRRGDLVDASRPPRGLTALMLAASSPQAGIEVLQYLLEHGADIDKGAMTSAGSALERAMRCGDLDKVRFLLEWNAAINPQRLWYEAAVSDGEPLANIDFLLEHSLPLGLITQSNGTPRGSALDGAAFLGRFDVVRRFQELGVSLANLAWTPLMQAISIGTVGDVKALQIDSTVLSERDRHQRTPWLLAVASGDIAKARLLLSAGANMADDDGVHGSALGFCAEHGNVPMLAWLLEQGADRESLNRHQQTPLKSAILAGRAASVRILLEAKAALAPRMIEAAHHLEVGKVLLAHDVALSALDFQLRGQMVGCRADGLPRASFAEFLAAPHRRFGTGNPEVMNEPFWLDMVDNRGAAWRPRKHYLGQESRTVSEFSDFKQPIWCFERFGSSISALPDGRFVEIGGEHEDHYDPDFCIYNDVVVHEGQGRVTIYGFPREVFPPTDFHSATVVGEFIYIIGSLGYPEDLQLGGTPVYRLDCRTFTMSRVITSGGGPGWIGRHTARLIEGTGILVSGGEVLVGLEDELKANEGEYVLDLNTSRWACS